MDTNADNILEFINHWVENPALKQIVALYGEKVPEKNLLDKLVWLEKFSAQHWDFRKGRERDFIEPKKFTSPETILFAAAPLGLEGENLPTQKYYDHVLILGGLAGACFTRSMYVASLFKEKTITSPHITALGGYRPLSKKEQKWMLENEGQTAYDEVHAMIQGMGVAFDLKHPQQTEEYNNQKLPYSQFLKQTYTTEKTTISVVAAPSSQPNLRRANTADSYQWWAKQTTPKPASALLITTDIYVPYQHADAIRILNLEHGIKIETIGTPNFSDTGNFLFSPQAYLQEIRSTICSYYRLIKAIESLKLNA